eukprot:Rmarinus@m.23668
MPSAAAKARKDAKKQARQSKLKKTDNDANPEIDEEKERMEKLASHRSCTGVLLSQKYAHDIKIGGFSIMQYGKLLIEDTQIELTIGRRYGLLGANGCGKSTFLQALAYREVPIPEHIDIFFLNKEAEPSEMTALETVVHHAKKEIERLEKEAESIAEEDPECDGLQDIFDRLDELDPDTMESRAAHLLVGLGFTKRMMEKKTKDLSGGWRMRVSLAEALFVKPTLLLLDDPTNHLDLEACVWLEDYLRNYNRCLVIVSHSQDFLNGVCTNIIEIAQKKLTYYGGNYDMFVQTKTELETNQLKQYEKEREDIKHIKQFIASAGTYANLVKQAKSKQKIIDKMEARGLTEKPVREKTLNFRFPSCGKLPLPVLAISDMSFSYSGKKEDMIYKDLDFGVDLESRIALVGPNGAGKSTLLKLMDDVLLPTSGTVQRHSHLRIGRYHQHLADILDLKSCALDYMRTEFADKQMDLEQWRSQLGRYGITGEMQTIPMENMSDGIRNRVAFCYLALKTPHMLLLDEPTNGLDMASIDGLADAINNFEGGLVLVSHDFRLINQVAKEIWVCENQTVTRWDSDIMAYKEHLRKKCARY